MAGPNFEKFPDLVHLSFVGVIKPPPTGNHNGKPVLLSVTVGISWEAWDPQRRKQQALKAISCSMEPEPER